MLNPLMLICLALPLLELVVLVKLGQAIGFWNTVLILLAMAVLGGLLLHRQGWKALQQAQTAMMEGQPPVGPMLDGMLLATAGALLLAPGLITDVFAFLLLIPPVRRMVANRLLGRARDGGRGPDDPFERRDGADKPSRGPASGGPVIEGEFERLDERPASKPREDRRDMRPG
jgi:UPF0716 protein FxsA